MHLEITSMINQTIKIEYFLYPFYTFFSLILFSYMCIDTTNFDIGFWLVFNSVFTVISVLFFFITIRLYLADRKNYHILNIVFSFVLTTIILVWIIIDIFNIFNVKSIEPLQNIWININYIGITISILLILLCFFVSFREDKMQHEKENK
jgi:hypothetical protein